MNALVGLCRLKPGGIHKGEKQKLLEQNEKKIPQWSFLFHENGKC